MKSFIASIATLALVGLAVGGAVRAADTTSVTATVTVQSISVSVSDGTVAYGTLAAGASQDTVALTDPQTATNNGNVTETLNIRGTVSSPTGWTLGATAGSDVYVHKFSKDAFVTAGTALTTNNQTLASGVAAGGSQAFDLRITTPNVSTSFGEQSVDVTVQATAP